jgi:hypothetical protein
MWPHGPRIPAAQREATAGRGATGRARLAVVSFMAQVAAASHDPVATAALREHTRATVRLDWADGPGATVRDEVARRDPVLAEDAATRFVVTRSCLDWLLRSNAGVVAGSAIRRRRPTGGDRRGRAA